MNCESIGYVILMNCESIGYVILMNVKVCYSDERESIGMLC